ncbi:MAG: nucleoside 2-deoxyribosyltransferase [Planctomycetota bacterium]
MPDEPGQSPVVYLAAPLFTQAERAWNRALADRLQRQVGCTVILPQDFGPCDEAASEESHEAIFRRCLDGVDRCDALIAVLDGADADSGTAFEMGYAHALAKPLIGLRTDFRQLQDQGANLMLARPCAALVRLTEFGADLDVVAEAVAGALVRCLGSG